MIMMVCEGQVLGWRATEKTEANALKPFKVTRCVIIFVRQDISRTLTGSTSGLCPCHCYSERRPKFQGSIGFERRKRQDVGPANRDGTVLNSRPQKYRCGR